MKKYFFFIILFCFFHTGAVHVSAKSLTFTASPTSLKGDDEMTVMASASGFTSDEQIFIKGSFYKDGSSNYFGNTKNGDSWIKNSIKTTDQRKVKISEWDGVLKVKSDFTDSGFSDSGNYKFKIGFYTIKSNGEPDDVTWSATVTEVLLTKPDPTQTPTNSPTRTPTPQPTNTPQPTSIPTTIKSPTPTTRRTPTIEPTPTEEEDEGEVLGEEITESPTPDPSPSPTPDPAESNSAISKHVVIPLVFVGAGCGILALVLVMNIIQKRRKIRGE